MIEVLHTIVALVDDIIVRNLHTRSDTKTHGEPKNQLTITPAIELKKTEYAERYDVKLLLLLSKFHGNMHRPTIAATYPPRRMFWDVRPMSTVAWRSSVDCAATHDEAGHEGGQITACADRVGGDVRAQLAVCAISKWAPCTQ